MRAKDVCEFLQGRMSGTSAAIVSGTKPVDPVNCVAITAGDTGRVNLDTLGLDSWSFQANVRGMDYDTAEDIMLQVYDAMHGAMDVSIGDYRVLSILAGQTPMYLGSDANAYAEFYVNFSLKAHKL